MKKVVVFSLLLVTAISIYLVVHGDGKITVTGPGVASDGLTTAPSQVKNIRMVAFSSKDSISPAADIKGPLEQTLPPLKELANKGDSVAACRIATEYELCGQLGRMRLDYDRWLADRQLAASLTEGAANARLLEESIRRESEIKEKPIRDLSRHCQNVDIPKNRIDDWRRAAFEGNIAAARYYASGNVFSNDSILDNLDKLAIYKNEAESLALSVARTGDLEMTLALASAYSPLPGSVRPFLAQAIVNKDASKALALFRRVENAIVSRNDPGLNSLLMDVRRRIEELEFHSAEEAGDPPSQESLFSDWESIHIDRGDRGIRGFGGVSRVGVRDCSGW